MKWSFKVGGLSFRRFSMQKVVWIVFSGAHLLVVGWDASNRMALMAG